MVFTQLHYFKLSTCCIQLSSLLLFKINHGIVKIVTPYFHRPGLLGRSLWDSVLNWKYKIRALIIVNTSYATIVGT